MSRTLTLAVRHEIVRRFNEGQSLRGIAADLQLSRHTVKRALEQHAQERDASQSREPAPNEPAPNEPPPNEPPPDEPAPGSRPRKTRRRSQLDAFEPLLLEFLERYPQITIIRLLEELRKQGYQGGYSILRDWVRQRRPASRREFTQRFETAPGVQAQMDYSSYDLDFSEEGRRRVSLFSYVLGYSRRQYLRFVESQDLQTTIVQHIRAFEYLGGAAATCLYDNMKVVVTRYEDGEPIYNTRFLAFATHYGFRPVACRPRRPQTKGKVERPFDYVEKNLLNGRTFRTLEHLNEVTEWWLREVADVRIHRTTGERPIDRHAYEAPRLLMLPDTPYDVSQVLYRQVDDEGFVYVAANGYSVPWSATHPGQTLLVKITEEHVIIYNNDLSELARHILLPTSVKGKKQRLPQHAPCSDTRQRREHLQQHFEQWGKTGQTFFEGLFKVQRYALVQAQRVLACLALYRRADVQAALERAVRYGAFSAEAVQRILANQATPKDIASRLSEEELTRWRAWQTQPDAVQRPVEFYQKLLFDASEDVEDSETQQETQKEIQEEPQKLFETCNPETPKTISAKPCSELSSPSSEHALEPLLQEPGPSSDRSSDASLEQDAGQEISPQQRSQEEPSDG